MSHRNPPTFYLKRKWTDYGILSVYRGGIEKYLDAAQQLINKYNLPDYYSQRITLIKEEISCLFDNNKPKQLSLLKFT